MPFAAASRARMYAFYDKVLELLNQAFQSFEDFLNLFIRYRKLGQQPVVQAQQHVRYHRIISLLGIQFPNVNLILS